jgi:hypothetical protein
MDCSTFHRSLEDYLQGGLDFPGRFGVERHAQQCLGCGKDLADAQTVSRLARELDRVQAPSDFEAQLHRRIQTRGLHRRPKLWKFQYFWWDRGSLRSLAWGMAGIVLLIGGLLYTVSRISNSPGLPDPSLTARNPEPEIAPVAEASRPPRIPGNNIVPRDTLPAASKRLYPTQPPESPFVLESDAPPWSIEPGDAEYVEYVVPAAGGKQLVMRLPKTIRMRHGQPSEEYFIRNVSH